ncbi:MAG: copper-binding protein [Thaumarchaeota archaeon]|nr:copper-binding protein [Nitrososphaerota archaeon]|tara:strand:+ start:248 stop:721 length:474 start_codon:yes stop_codon:yes gene_type:complete
MAAAQRHSPFGVGVIAFVLAVSVSIGFYIFAYLPVITARPQIPEEILEPEKTIEILIIAGSADPEQEQNYIQKRVEVQLGFDNKVIWINKDTTAHTVTTDNNVIDKYSGLFDSLETVGLVKPGESWEFLFTQEGEFPYHCEPHPWMKGLVKVIKQKF